MKGTNITRRKSESSAQAIQINQSTRVFWPSRPLLSGAPATTGADAPDCVLAAVEWARKEQLKLLPLCPFAKAIFDRDASLRDVLP